jgi:hypothetical protein
VGSTFHYLKKKGRSELNSYIIGIKCGKTYGRTLRMKEESRKEKRMEKNIPYTVKPALNGNIFRSRDFGAQKDVKYPGLNGNCLTRKRKSK